MIVCPARAGGGGGPKAGAGVGARPKINLGAGRKRGVRSMDFARGRFARPGINICVRVARRQCNFA